METRKVQQWLRVASRGLALVQAVVALVGSGAPKRGRSRPAQGDGIRVREVAAQRPTEG